MAKVKTKKYAYIVYRYNEFKDDFEYIKEYYTIKEIKKTFDLKNLRQYTATTIDNIKHLIQGQYGLIKERLQ